jgi:hypothetical protein
MRKLLLEGGVAGHLSHLYDNRELTANKMFKILSLASQGELVGTEKTDGYNIYLGFRDGKSRYARNKGDMAAGGRSMEDLIARKWAGGDAVGKVYLKAFESFDRFINGLPPNVQAGIFGEDGSIFYNAEIQGPGANNVTSYDANVVTIHQVNHKRYDAETNQLEIIDVAENSRFLDKAINQMEQKASEEGFQVQRTAVMRLKKLDDDHDLQIAVAKIQKAGFTGDLTIEEYLENKLMPPIQQSVPYMSEQVHQMMVDYILQKKGEDGKKVGLRDIYKGFPPDQRAVVRDYLDKKNSSKLLKNAIWPLEDAIHDFAVELLRDVESAYILDNKSEVSRVKAEVGAAIRAIQSYSGPGQEEAKDILALQLSKIKHIDNINSTVEGFVFEFDGMTYKFTGNFAPVNQLLGLFRYGRGSAPPLARAAQGEQDLEEAEEVSHTAPERVLAILPGAYKPPHRGHFEMALHYAGIADVVAIYISSLDREGVDFNTSRAIWNIYKSSSRDPNAGRIEILPKASENNSPVGAALEFVSNENGDPNLAQPGDHVILGASTKSDSRGSPDYMRFKDAQKYYGPGVSGGMIEDTAKYAFKITSDEPLSARDFRTAVRNGDTDTIKRYLPEDVIQNAGAVEAVLDAVGMTNTGDNRDASLTEVIQQLVQEAIDNQDLDLSEMSGMGGVGGGSIEGAAGGLTDEDSEDELEEELEEEALIEKVMNYLLS